MNQSDKIMQMLTDAVKYAQENLVRKDRDWDAEADELSPLDYADGQEFNGETAGNPRLFNTRNFNGKTDGNPRVNYTRSFDGRTDGNPQVRSGRSFDARTAGNPQVGYTRNFNGAQGGQKVGYTRDFDGRTAGNPRVTSNPVTRSMAEVSGPSKLSYSTPMDNVPRTMSVNDTTPQVSFDPASDPQIINSGYKVNDRSPQIINSGFQATGRPSSVSAQAQMQRDKSKKKRVRFGEGSNMTLNYKGRRMANVSAEQLKASGLNLTGYMNAWKALGERPTPELLTAAYTA